MHQQDSIVAPGVAATEVIAQRDKEWELLSLSNEIANEAIAKRDEEKTLLLAFSSDIATVRDKAGLRLVIKQYLKNIFHIREYIITTRNSDGQTYSYFLHDLQADEPTDDGFKIMKSNQIPVEGAITGAVL